MYILLEMAHVDEQAELGVAEEVSTQCIAFRLRFLNRIITNLYDQALQPLDIKVNQASMLVALFIHGESTPAAIGRLLQMEKSTVSRNMDRMRKKGWVEITDKDRGPSQIIRVTPKGKELLAAIHAGWTRAQKTASNLLGDEGVRAVHMLYETVRHARSGDCEWRSDPGGGTIESVGPGHALTEVLKGVRHGCISGDKGKKERQGL